MANDGRQQTTRIVGVAGAFQTVQDENDGTLVADGPVQVQKIAVG
jgi:hypothetical protein